MKRLLAVDDHPDSAELIARVAAKCGYDAQILVKLGSLRTLLQDWKPAIVTLDLCMPEEDGIDVFTTLNDARFEGDLIIVSGQDSWLRKTACRLAAAQGLRVVDDLSKPVDLAVLRALLTRLQTDGPAN
jgi:two-component system chemotaxis response regulator CheB